MENKISSPKESERELNSLTIAKENWQSQEMANYHVCTHCMHTYINTYHICLCNINTRTCICTNTHTHKQSLAGIKIREREKLAWSWGWDCDGHDWKGLTTEFPSTLKQERQSCQGESVCAFGEVKRSGMTYVLHQQKRTMGSFPQAQAQGSFWKWR